MLHAASAGWRNNPVHAQAFPHLAVFIGGVNYRSGNDHQPWLVAAERWKLIHRIFRRKALRGAMSNRERVLQKLDDLRFRLEFFRTVAALDVVRQLFSGHSAP